MDLARFQRDEALGAVGNDDEVDAVEIGQPGLEVIRIPLHPDDRAALPFLEAEWTGPDRPRVRRVVAVVGAGVDVLRHHWRARRLEGVDEAGIRCLQPEHHTGPLSRPAAPYSP